MVASTAKTFYEQLRDIKELYVASGQPWPASARQIAVWAINKGHYKAHRDKMIAKAADDFAAAMRDEHYTDPQGRRVRTLHAARVYSKSKSGTREQQMLWHDIRIASHDFMERAFQLRRRQIVGDCRQLKNDVDSYNDNHPNEKPIQLLLDFTDDTAEANQPREYVPNKPR
jgi:hypothetical protein